MTVPSRRRRPGIPVVAAALAITALLTGVTGPAEARSAPDPLHQDLTAIVDGGATSALAVVRDERGIHAVSVGPRRIDRSGSVDPDGRFRAGSVTKSLLATVVLQLADAGRLRLSDPIARYVSGIPAGGEITVRMLLDHTSGLYNYSKSLPLSPPSGFLAIRWRHWTPDQLLALATSQPLQFDPGKGYGYSDTDYLVLGKLITAVSGHRPDVEIRRRIIVPLHLRDTDEPSGPNLHGRHAHGYLPTDDGSPVDITRFDTSVLEYSGDLVSSGVDLNRFFRALSEGRLLRPTTTRQMLTVRSPAHDMGLGVERLTPTCGGEAWGHDGDVPGFSTWSFTAPQTGRSVTVSMVWGTERPKAAVLHLVDDALCGRTDARQ